MRQARQPPVVSRGIILRHWLSALSRPLPQDRAIFSTLDLVLTEIRRCYIELDKFWTEEISHTVEALNSRRIPPSDFERWTNTHTNLKQTIEFWKVY